MSGVSVNGDTITIDTTKNVNAVNDAKLVVGKSLSKVNDAGSSAERSTMYFAPTDQYGKTAQKLAQVLLVSEKDTITKVVIPTSTVTLNNDGLIIAGGFIKGHTYTIAGVATNGLVSTIKIVIK